MAVIGVFETSLDFGTINTSASTTKKINFGASSILATPFIQRFINNDDDAGISLSIQRFTDAGGVKNGPFVPGVFADNCTSVTFRMDTNDSIGRAVLRILFFG